MCSMAIKSDTASDWVRRALDILPGTDDVLFDALWAKRRLVFDGSKELADTVDEFSARLVVSTLRRQERLFLVLPDYEPHRPALLFATALIRDFLDSHTSPTLRNVPILYFGSTIGIRDQLANTTVTSLGMNLSEVFRQRDVRRTGADRSNANRIFGTDPLPQVVTVYAPADPVGLMKSYRPKWIAMDCFDTASLPWLKVLMNEAIRRRLAVIAWGQNPLSECVKDFSESGHVFVWPSRIQQRGQPQPMLNADPTVFLGGNDTTVLLPKVLDGDAANDLSSILREATHTLAEVSQNAQTGFARDAVSVHWRLLRALESLAVPLDFYEAEATRLWGLKSVAYLESTCTYFREVCDHNARHLNRNLSKASSLLAEAINRIRGEGCCLWNAMVNLCIEDIPSGETRILVFSGDSRKRLFLFSLLANQNTSEDDLRELGIYAASLADLRRWTLVRYKIEDDSESRDLMMPPVESTWRPILVGLPSPVLNSRLLCAFVQPCVEILIYPHQRPSLKRREIEWSRQLSADSTHIVKNLSRLSGLPIPAVMPTFPPRMTLSEAVEIDSFTAERLPVQAAGALWEPDGAVAEVSAIFENADEPDEEEAILVDRVESDSTTTSSTSDDLWAVEAVRVRFEQGWSVHFAPDDMINVVRTEPHGYELDQRYVSSLRVGDRVVLIQGQRRQSLYDLIISRVHKHPSIELHLAMIRRWQEDLRISFAHWSSEGGIFARNCEDGPRDLNDLLSRMQSLGSNLVSTLTLSFWLKGYVLCPHDPEDLRRVSEILDMYFVKQYYSRIALAANRLRGLHRGLSRKMNRWLGERASGSINRSDDEIIDEELGLTFGDIRNSLLVLRVEEKDNVYGLFLRSQFGGVERTIGEGQ